MQILNRAWIGLLTNTEFLQSRFWRSIQYALQYIPNVVLCQEASVIKVEIF